MRLDQDEVKAAYLLRVSTTEEDEIEAMSNVLFERMTDAELNQYARLMGEIVRVDGRRDFSPAQMYSVALAAVFATTGEA